MGTDQAPRYEELWSEVLRILALLKHSHDVQFQQEQQRTSLSEPANGNRVQSSNKPVNLFVDLADAGKRKDDGVRQLSIEIGGSNHEGRRRKDLHVGVEGMLDGGGRLDNKEEQKEKGGVQVEHTLKRNWGGVLGTGEEEDHGRRDHEKKQKKNAPIAPENDDTRSEDMRNLKQVLRDERQKNEALRAENNALKAKVGTILAAVNSQTCGHCQSVYQEHKTVIAEIPEAPSTSKKPKSRGAPPVVEEEVAVDVIRSKFLMPQKSADKALSGRISGYQGRRRSQIPGVGNIGSNLEAPNGFGQRSPEELSEGRKERGPEVLDPIEGEGEISENSKHPSDGERERTELRRSRTVSHNMRSSPQGFEPSLGYSISVDKFPEKGNALVAVEQVRSEPSQEGGSDEGSEAEEDNNGVKALNGTDSEETESESEKTETESEETETDSELKGMSTRMIKAPPLRGSTGKSSPSSVALHMKEQAQSHENPRRKQERSHGPRSAVGKYTEFKCGITRKDGVDTYGLLKVYQQSGIFQVFCHCGQPGCSQDKPMTPGYFEKHGGRAASKKWRESIWIEQDNQRMPISRIKELDVYIRTPQRKT